MPFLDQFQRGVDVAKFKANQLSRINKLQNDIANMTGEIQGLRKQLADTTIQLHNANTELPLQLKELCKKISQLESNISNIGQTINNIRAETYSPSSRTEPTLKPEGGAKNCPHCTKTVPHDAEYCIHCGEKISNLKDT